MISSVRRYSLFPARLLKDSNVPRHGGNRMGKEMDTGAGGLEAQTEEG